MSRKDIIINMNMQQIIYEDIVAPTNPTGYSYGRGKYGDFEVIIMKETGYINASKLCKLGGKNFCDWNRRGNLDLIRDLNIILISENHPGRSTIEINNTHSQAIRGTYVHPKLVYPIAAWISHRFWFKLYDWVEQWRSYCMKNELEYWKGISECILNPTSTNQNREKEIQEMLCLELEDAQMEIETCVGRIDILTTTEIIEIKEASKWKHALGQILSYGTYYPGHQKVIYLFDHQDTDIDLVKNIVSKLDIEVRLHST